MKKDFITALMCKCKRLSKIISEPYVRNRMKMDIDLYPSQGDESAVNCKVDTDYSVKVVNIVAIIGVLVLISSFFSLFRRR